MNKFLNTHACDNKFNKKKTK